MQSRGQNNRVDGTVSIEQLRELESRLTTLRNRVDSIDNTEILIAEEQIPALVNFLNNSDFIYQEEEYNSTAFADDEDVLAEWYMKAQSDATAYDFNESGVEGTDSIRRSAYTGGAKAGVEWDDSTGTILLTGGYRIGGKLVARYANRGNYLAVRMQLKNRSDSTQFTFTVDTVADTIEKVAHGLSAGTRVRLDTTDTLPKGLLTNTDYYVINTTADDFQISDTSGGSALDISNSGTGTHTLIPMIPEDLICKVSIFDNDDVAVIEGTKPTMTLSKLGSHTGGTVTREYILEIVMPDGTKFYSDTVTPASVTNTVSTASTDSSNRVSIQWEDIVGSVRYNLYRRETAGTWYLISSITNGTSLAIDYGGTGLSSWTPPTVFDQYQKEYHKADAYYVDVGEILQDNALKEITLGIQVPTLSNSTGTQVVQIEFLKGDYTNSTASDIVPDGMMLDKVGISYTNGRWCPSARDISLSDSPTNTPVPPPSTGGSGNNPPSGGGLDTRCVEEHSLILVWSDSGDHYYMPANKIVAGDTLVSWDYVENRIAPSKVKKVIKGISRTSFTIFSKNNSLESNFSHRYITSMEDFAKGTRVSIDLEDVLAYRDNEIYKESIVSINMADKIINTRSFVLEKNRRNYIANGFFCHNKLNDIPVIE